MDIYTSKHELIKISDSPLASGGEGEVREIISSPAQYKGTCAKIYYQQKRTTQQAGKIKYMESASLTFEELESLVKKEL